MRELLAGYERLLATPGAPPPTPRRPPPPAAPRARPPAAPAEGPGATVSAGPFATTEAVRSFEQAVAGLPGVREVSVRAYEGTDRAILDVRLDHPSP